MSDYSNVPAYDKQRGFAFFMYSVWYNAYPWNRYLEFTTNPANKVLTTPVRRAVITTCLFNPLFYLPTFYLGYGLMNFQSTETMKTKMTTEYPEAVKQILMVYAPIYALQFTVIPPALQVAYSSVANFCWCVILSSLASADAILDEETHKFERFDSSAITVGTIVEQAKELPSELSMSLDSVTIDKVFQQLKAGKQAAAAGDSHGQAGGAAVGSGSGHKTKAVECEEAGEKHQSADAAPVCDADKHAEEDFQRLVRSLSHDRYKFFNSVQLRKAVEAVPATAEG